MLVDTNWMREKYDYFNKLLFNGELPKNIQFKIVHKEHIWGTAYYCCNLYTEIVTPTKIEISNYYDSPEEVKMGVLIHEMIHIADYQFNQYHYVRNHKLVTGREYDRHGNVFFIPEMNRVNTILKEEGLNIVVGINISDEEVNSSKLSPSVQKRVNKNKENGVYVLLFTDIKKNKDGFSRIKYTSYKKWINYLENSEWWKKMYKNTDLYKTFDDRMISSRGSTLGRGWYLSVSRDEVIKKYNLKFVKRIPNENFDDKPQEKEIEPQTEDERIPLFTFSLVGGRKFEMRNATKEEVFNKLKEEFPKWSDEVVNNLIEKYWNMDNKVLNEKKIKNMIRETAARMIKNEESANIVGMRQMRNIDLGDGNFIGGTE